MSEKQVLRLKVNEAIMLSEVNGKKVMKKELAAKIWESSSPEAQQVNMTNLCSGITKRIKPDWIVIICQTLGCSADFLLGLKETID